MRKTSLRLTRGIALLLFTLGFMGLTAGSAGAQLQPGEGCAPEGDRFILSLADPNEDGVITIAELQEIADSLPAGEQKDTFNDLIAQAESQGVTGIRYDITGPCPPPATVGPTATTAAPTATTAAPTATTAAPTATTAPGTETATSVPATETATTAPGTETAVATETAAATATTAPDDGDDDGGAGDDGSDDGGAGDDGGDDGSDDGVSELPDTGQGSASDEGSSILVMLLGGTSLLVAAGFLWTRLRTS
jgi:hypothetical protein